MNRNLRIASLLLLSLAAVVAAEEQQGGPTTQPSPAIKASDKPALDASMNKDATVEGTVSRAAWSASGKVMVIRFQDTEDSGFTAVVFERNKSAFDKAFNGDVTAALSAADIRVTGKLVDYRGKPEIVLNKPSQLTILKTPATRPTP